MFLLPVTEPDEAGLCPDQRHHPSHWWAPSGDLQRIFSWPPDNSNRPTFVPDWPTYECQGRHH